MNSVISIVARSSGRIHVAPLRYGGGGGGSNGHSATASERICAVSDSSRRWLKPVPTPPANTNTSPSKRPTSSEPKVPVRLPSPVVNPPITTSTRRRFLTLRQFGERLPGTYGRPESLRHHAFEILLVGGVEQGLHRRRSGGPRRTSCRPARRADRAVAADPRTAGRSCRGRRPGARRTPPAPPGGRGAAAVRTAAGPASSSTTSSASRIADSACTPVGQVAQLGIVGGDVVQVRRLQPDAPVVDERERAIAVPLDLVRPALVVAGKRAEPGLHRSDRERQRHVASVPDRHPRQRRCCRPDRRTVADRAEVSGCRRDCPPTTSCPLRSGLRCAWNVWAARRRRPLRLPQPADAGAGRWRRPRLVERGAVFPLNWTMALPDPPLFGRKRLHATRSPAATSTVGHDDVLDNWNTQSSSQWDGFRHIRHPAVRDDEPGTGHFGGVDDERARHRPLGAARHRDPRCAGRHRSLA